MERGCAVQPWIERVDGVDMVLVGCGGWRAEGGGWRVEVGGCSRWVNGLGEVATVSGRFGGHSQESERPYRSPKDVCHHADDE